MRNFTDADVKKLVAAFKEGASLQTRPIPSDDELESVAWEVLDAEDKTFEARKDGLFEVQQAHWNTLHNHDYHFRSHTECPLVVDFDYAGGDFWGDDPENWPLDKAMRQCMVGGYACWFNDNEEDDDDQK